MRTPESEKAFELDKVLDLPIDPRDFGAKGDGMANDTEAFAKVAAAGGSVHISDGVYSIDEWVIDRPINVLMSSTAVLKLRRLLPIAPGEVQAVVRLKKGCVGSTFIGLNIDGNRDALGSGFLRDTFVMGFRSEDADGLILRDIRIKNAICHGAYIFGGSGLTIDGIHAADCSQAVVIDSLVNSTVRNLNGTNIRNNGLAVYQHAFELRNLDRTHIDGVRVDGHFPDQAGLDAGDIGVDITRMYNHTTIRNISLSRYDGSSDRTSLGVSVTGARDFQLERVTVESYDMGVDILGAREMGMSKVFIDCQWRPNAFFGLRIEGAAAYAQDSASRDLRANSNAVGITMNDIRICRAIDGVVTDGKNLQFTDVKSFSNLSYGLVLRGDIGNRVQFPGSPRLIPENIDFSGFSAHTNGRDGVFISDAHRVSFHSADIYNNGQDPSATSRNGFTFWGARPDALADNVTIGRGVAVYDDQDWTLTGGASFVPGPSDSDRCKVIYMLDASKIELNQRICLRGVAPRKATLMRLAS